MSSKKLLIFSAPSGAGKTTIVHHLLQKFPQLYFSISATNRAPRGQEVNGKDYHFLSTETFQQKISDNEFVEWEEVYPGSFYGTLKSELEKAWAEGKYVAFDVDVEGGIKLKKLFGSQALSIFIMPPSIQALEQRLKARKTETPESLAKRVNKAALELTKSTKFDTVILNDQLNIAFKDTEKAVRNFLNLPV